MELLKKFTKKDIFEKVAEIANGRKKSKIKNPTENQIKQNKSKSKTNHQIYDPSRYLDHQESEQQPTYSDAQQFILNLNQNAKAIKKQQIQKKTKKQVFSQLEIQPIYLQQCKISQLFKMQIEMAQSGSYQRTQTLHNYLNQVNHTLKKILFTENLEILQIFDIVNNHLNRVNQILTKIKLMRQSLNPFQVQKAKKIRLIMKKKLFIKQKLSLLTTMKQKQQICLVKPQNIEQVYYSQRNRHKLYNRIINFTTENSFFKILRSQLITISTNNIKIIQKTLDKWINKGQQMRDKDIEKLFICLYFVKTENVYKNNKLCVNLKNINEEKLIKEIQLVKQWKNYRYIVDPTIKSKIVQFLDTFIKQIRC